MTTQEGANQTFKYEVDNDDPAAEARRQRDYLSAVVANALGQVEQLAACHLEASNDRKSPQWERKGHAYAYGGVNMAVRIMRAALSSAYPGDGMASERSRKDGSSPLNPPSEGTN